MKDIDQIATLSRIDLSKDIPKPPSVLKIDGSRVMTLGNFSVITGKSKSKKTFLTTLVASTIVSGGLYHLASEGGSLVTFDTEQGDYDAWSVAKRIEKITGKTDYRSYALRQYEPEERCEIIEEILKQQQPKFVVIDGIADLANAINDEEEATRVSGLLMRWTKQYNSHITTIIHQNKSNNYATGHLGSALMKKAEVIISVSKDDDNKYLSLVECDMIRGAKDFDPFEIEIDKNGLPTVVGKDKYQNNEEYLF